MADLVLRFGGSSATSRVRIARGSLARLGSFTRRVTGAERVAIVADRTVARLYGARAWRAFRAAGLEVATIVLPAGERTKSAEHLAALWDALARAEIGRRDAVVALGGGVVGDLAGFAASTWLRGVPWVAAPTTLLAMVDASVGGKTAIDLPAGKNLAGAFHQPAGVLADPDVLATLPARHRRAGLAEVAKMGAALDLRLFAWLERHAAAARAGDLDVLAGAVSRGVRVKARVVMADEREREGGVRTALNYGHTTAHALERVLGYRGLLHGEAVALGMRVGARLSARVAGLPASDAARQEALLDALGLPKRLPHVPAAALIDAMAHDKKRARAGVRWVLTPTMGHASVPRLISSRVVRAVLLDAGAR